MSSIDTRITPVSSDYETCAECFVRLMIYPGDIHPDRITNILGVAPTSVSIKGDKVTNSRGLIREVKNSAWFLSSEGEVESKDIREHIDWVVCQLQAVTEGLKRVRTLKDIKITLRCVWFSAFGHSGPVLWPEQMKALAELDLECSFDIYFEDFK